MMTSHDRQRKLREVSQRLLNSHAELQDAFLEAKDIVSTEKVEVDVDVLINYAQKIGYTTFAPASYTLGAPMGHPPAPQEEQFRASELHQYKEKHNEVARKAAAEEAERALAAKKAADAARRAKIEAAERAKIEELSKAIGIAPSEFKIPEMPKGWKPGQKLDLTDIMPQLKPPPIAPGAHSSGVAAPAQPSPAVQQPVKPAPPPQPVIHVPLVGGLDLGDMSEDEEEFEYVEESASSDDSDMDD